MSELRPETVLEIVELDDGELAIRDPESDGEPLIVVNFSDQLREQLEEQYVDVARVMLTAGIQMVAETGLNLGQKEEEPQPTIH